MCVTEPPFVDSDPVTFISQRFSPDGGAGAGGRGQGRGPAIRARAPRPSGFEHDHNHVSRRLFSVRPRLSFPTPARRGVSPRRLCRRIQTRFRARARRAGTLGHARKKAASLSSPSSSSSPPPRVPVVHIPAPRRSVPPPEPSYDAGERRVRFLADGFEIFVKRPKPLEHRRHRREPPLRERAHDVRAKRRLALDQKRGE
jgi:hypothetical protein